jgi:hypothetical protein
LQLAFESKSLRLKCESEAEAIRVLGTGVAAHLKRRLADLRAAESIDDLQTGRLTLQTDRQTLTIDLSEGYFLVCTPNHATAKESGGVPDWSRIRRVKIIKIRFPDDA